eukprot:gene10607-12385_t
MSRKRAKVSSKSTAEKTQFDLEEEELMLRVDQLSSGQNDMRNETTDLKSSLGELLDKYISREESFQRTVKDFQEHCVQKAQKMEKEANQVRADAATEATALIAAAKLEIDEWEAEKKKLSVIKTFERKIKLDVGGNRFTTSLTTLRRFPDTMLGAMFSGRHAMHLDEEGYYFIDRDGTHFRYILNFLRSPETFECELTGAGLKELNCECDYYGILEIMFPFVTIPPFACNNSYSHHQIVTVSQNSYGVWSVNQQPLKICPNCYRTDYSHCGVVGHTAGYMYLKNFPASVQAKGGSINWSAQPKPTPTCVGCGRA